MDAPDACSTARAAVDDARLRLTGRPIPIPIARGALEGEGDAARCTGRAAAAVRGIAMPEPTRPDAILSHSPDGARGRARTPVDEICSCRYGDTQPMNACLNGGCFVKLIERGTRVRFRVRG